MKHLIEIPLANGQTVIVEVDGAETSALPITPRRGVREFVEEQIVEQGRADLRCHARQGQTGGGRDHREASGFEQGSE